MAKHTKGDFELIYTGIDEECHCWYDPEEEKNTKSLGVLGGIDVYFDELPPT